jgi:hypothetical protein
LDPGTSAAPEDLILFIRMIGGLKSARLKLIRAEKHLSAIKRCIDAYSASKPHKIVRKAKGNKKINVRRPPPLEISILVGEMVYQMRSALDHLAFDLVQMNPSITTIDPNWSRNCQFPLKMKTPGGCAPPLAKKEFKDLPGISDEAYKYIESIQPYYGIGPVNNSLKLLAHLSNIDKHRHLNLIRPRVRKRERVRYPDGMESEGWEFLERGAVLNAGFGENESNRPTYVSRRYQALAFFNEDALGDATDVPVDVLLYLIWYHIDTFLVRDFEKLLEKP